MRLLLLGFQGRSRLTFFFVVVCLFRPPEKKYRRKYMKVILGETLFKNHGRIHMKRARRILRFSSENKRREKVLPELLCWLVGSPLGNRAAVFKKGKQKRRKEKREEVFPPGIVSTFLLLFFFTYLSPFRGNNGEEEDRSSSF